jgi:uncharacterized protein (TIGR03435 family)
MMRISACLSLPALLSVAAFSQPTETAAKFELTDVHNSPRITQPLVRGPFHTSGRYELRFATMLDLIRIAYGVDPEKVAGGPSWLEMDRFDVFAKTPDRSTAESRKLMLQALLADRFKLVVHNDGRPMAAYALTAAKRPQLKEADGSGESGCNFTVQNAPTGPPAPGTPITLPTIVYTCRNTTMAAFAGGMLSIPGAAQYFNNKLVVDQTELKGAWDFSIRFTPKIPAGIQTTGENIPIFDALEKQLGLKLEMSTVPMPMIVVDSVNQKPTENSPDAMKSFPVSERVNSALVDEPQVRQLRLPLQNEVADDASVHLRHGHAVARAADRIDRSAAIHGADLGGKIRRHGECSAPAMRDPNTAQGWKRLADELLQVRPRLGRRVVVHAPIERHMPRTAAGQNAPIAGEPIEMHEAAAVFDRLTAFPAQRFELIRG